MRTVRIECFETETPRPGPGRVLVRVDAAADAHRTLEHRRTSGKLLLLAWRTERRCA